MGETQAKHSIFRFRRNRGRLKAGRKADALIQLFNLAEDLGETKDVASQQADMAKRLSEIMMAEHIPSEPFPFGRER